MIDAEKADTIALIKGAAERASESPREAVLPPDTNDLVRERRRRKLLTSIAAGLVPITLGVNIWLYPRGGSGPELDLSTLNVAIPVSEAVPIGGILYSRIATFLWDGMSDAERTRKLSDLGRIAGRQGYRSVVVVDDARLERAYWSATAGVVLRAPADGSGPASGSEMRLGPIGP